MRTEPPARGEDLAPAWQLVTGEAVGLDLRLARLPSRGLALLVDVALQLAALVVLTLVAARLLDESDEALAAALQLVLTVAVLVGYPVASETLRRGRTAGKALLGLRVVRDDGGPVRFRQALVRGLLAFFVDIWLTLGIGAMVAATVSRRGKRVGDVLAGTVVVRERAPRSLGTPPAMPPHLAGWAAGADLAMVDDAVALAARQVLGRRTQLSPAAYQELCRRVATAAAHVVSPRPPDGTTAEDYLSAVVAERRRRTVQRGAPVPVAPAPPGPPPPIAPPPAGPTADGFALPG